MRRMQCEVDGVIKRKEKGGWCGDRGGVKGEDHDPAVPDTFFVQMLS
jgi:hypothetical protein